MKRVGLPLVLALLAGLPACGGAAGRDPAVPETAGPSRSAPASPPQEPGQYLKIADFAEWRVDDRRYLLRDAHRSGAAAKLTHLEYSFGDVSDDGLCVSDATNDYQRLYRADQSVDGTADTPRQKLAGNFNQLRKLKAAHPNLKVVFSLGGWSMSNHFSDAALTAESRRRFVESCVGLFVKGNLPVVGGQPQGGPGAAAGIFDGIDVDWEWPGSQGERGNVVRREDKQNFTLLLAEFRRQLDEYGAQAGRRLTLSTFLTDDPERIRAGFEPGEIFRYLDYATVNGFDLHGPWDRRTNHHAQLYTPPADPSAERSSVDRAVNTWLDLHAPARKLSVAVAAFGHGWRGVPADNDGLYQRAAGPAAGGYEPGAEDYRVLATRQGQRHRDARAGAQWLYDGDEWWSFDDPEVIRQKAAYVKDRGLGGMTLWSLDGDDQSASLVAAMHGVLR
jgi:chitinase